MAAMFVYSYHSVGIMIILCLLHILLWLARQQAPTNDHIIIITVSFYFHSINRTIREFSVKVLQCHTNYRTLFINYLSDLLTQDSISNNVGNILT